MKDILEASSHTWRRFSEHAFYLRYGVFSAHMEHQRTSEIGNDTVGSKESTQHCYGYITQQDGEKPLKRDSRNNKTDRMTQKPTRFDKHKRMCLLRFISVLLRKPLCRLSKRINIWLVNQWRMCVKRFLGTQLKHTRHGCRSGKAQINFQGNHAQARGESGLPRQLVLVSSMAAQHVKGATPMVTNLKRTCETRRRCLWRVGEGSRREGGKVHPVGTSCEIHCAQCSRKGFGRAG